MNIFPQGLFGHPLEIQISQKQFCFFLFSWLKENNDMSLEKTINILDYSLSSLWRHKGKNLSVILVFASVIFLVASFQLTTQALIKMADTTLKNSPEIIIQKMSAGRQESIPLAYMSKLSEIFGIQRLVPRIWGYYFDEISGANYTVLAIDPELLPEPEKINDVFTDGHFPTAGEAAMGSGVSEAMGLAGRQVFSLHRNDLSRKSFRLSGVFDSVTDMLTSDTLLMPLEDGRDLFGISSHKVTDLCVYVTNKAEINTIAQKISALLPDTRVVTLPQMRKTYKMVFSWRSGFASICLLTALTAFIIFAWDKASGLSPEDKKEIAILKILGWQTGDILSMRFWEGLLVSSFAFMLGYSLAFIHVGFFSASLFRPILVGWSVIAPNLRLSPDVVLGDLILILCLTVIPYLAATVIPAWKSSIIPPDAAMH